MTTQPFSGPTQRALAALGATLLLAACASTPPAIQRYTLPQLASMQVPASTPLASTVTVQLEPVNMAEYLDSRGLLYQSSDITITEAGGHVWAENIREQLSRALRQELAAMVAPLQVRDAMQMLPIDAKDYLLIVQVERFQGRHDGLAVLSGSWSLRDAAGRLLETHPYLLEKALAQDGYPALVRSLDDAWRELATQIAQGLANRDERLHMVAQP